MPCFGMGCSVILSKLMIRVVMHDLLSPLPVTCSTMNSILIRSYRIQIRILNELHCHLNQYNSNSTIQTVNSIWMDP